MLMNSIQNKVLDYWLWLQNRSTINNLVKHRTRINKDRLLNVVYSFVDFLFVIHP
jgi:hypothetical protein